MAQIAQLQITKPHAPNLRKKIEESKQFNGKEKENSSKENFTLERMTVIALKRACEVLGVKYWQ